jgi:UPF0288 family protein (methanogenesis marker protein 3)
MSKVMNNGSYNTQCIQRKSAILPKQQPAKTWTIVKERKVKTSHSLKNSIARVGQMHRNNNYCVIV